ncbi:hypothetical protein [Nitrosomonas sp.]|uniref:hypothetical protein n=1 Tax=Nitrosomonas sp. TaxID=42353 RepID=UPI00374DD26E
MLRIIREARNRGCFLELNAHPERLDLLDTQCQMAKEEGVLISINSVPIAFTISPICALASGKRGWLEKNDVLNIRSLKELRHLINRTMS